MRSPISRGVKEKPPDDAASAAAAASSARAGSAPAALAASSRDAVAGPDRQLSAVLALGLLVESCCCWRGAAEPLLNCAPARTVTGLAALAWQADLGRAQGGSSSGRQLVLARDDLELGASEPSGCTHACICMRKAAPYNRSVISVCTRRGAPRLQPERAGRHGRGMCPEQLHLWRLYLDSRLAPARDLRGI